MCARYAKCEKSAVKTCEHNQHAPVHSHAVHNSDVNVYAFRFPCYLYVGVNALVNLVSVVKGYTCSQTVAQNGTECCSVPLPGKGTAVQAGRQAIYMTHEWFVEGAMVRLARTPKAPSGSWRRNQAFRCVMCSAGEPRPWFCVCRIHQVPDFPGIISIYQ